MLVKKKKKKKFSRVSFPYNINLNDAVMTHYKIWSNITTHVKILCLGSKYVGAFST